MTTQDRDETSASADRSDSKLFAAPSAKVRIAFGSIALLILGAWFAPPDRAAALAPPPERTAPLLEEQVQLRQAREPFRGVQEIPPRVHDAVVTILASDLPDIGVNNDYFEPRRPMPPGGFGVYVADRFVLTHSIALDGRAAARVMTRDGMTLEARVAVYEPSTGLALLEIMQPAQAATDAVSDAIEPGALVVAVGRRDGNPMVVPVFVTSASATAVTVSATGEPLLPGTPVFTLSGDLLAVAAGRGGEAFPAAESVRRLLRRAERGERHASIGAAFQNLGGPLTGVFGERGVLVTHVVASGPADDAGIEAGDVILAVGGQPVDDADTATLVLNMASIEGPLSVQFSRANRSRVVEVTPRAAYEVAALHRAATVAPTAPEARALFPQPLLEAAGIPPVARVLAVNGRAVTTRAQANRELRRRRGAVPLLLRVGDVQFFGVLEGQS